MRKGLTILLALLVLCAAGSAFAVRDICADKETVAYTETVLYGDPAIMDGLRVDLRENFRRALVWDSAVSFKNGSFEAETKYSFSARSMMEYYPPQEKGYRITLSTTTAYWKVMGVPRPVLWKVAEEMERDGVETRTVHLADYYDNYPFHVSISDGDKLLYDSENGVGTLKGRPIYKALQEFFKIPVLESQDSVLRIKKDFEGKLEGYTTDRDVGDSFFLQTDGVIGKNGYFFWFDTHVWHDGVRGQDVVDTSRIPGGYGIYILPYSGDGVDSKGLSLFCPLAPETNILTLGISEDKKELLLHTEENGIYVITVISAETGETLQRLEVGSYVDGLCWAQGTAGFILLKSDTCLYAVTKGEDGQYRVALQAPIQEFERRDSYAPWNAWMGNSIAFDGERLVVACYNLHSWVNEDFSNLYWEDMGCGFYAAVYTNDGLQYYGEYDSSLDQSGFFAGSEQGSIHLFAGDVAIEEENIRPFIVSPVTASWQS